jgi:hypothetical protein
VSLSPEIFILHTFIACPLLFALGTADKQMDSSHNELNSFFSVIPIKLIELVLIEMTVGLVRDLAEKRLKASAASVAAAHAEKFPNEGNAVPREATRDSCTTISRHCQYNERITLDVLLLEWTRIAVVCANSCACACKMVSSN